MKQVGQGLYAKKMIPVLREPFGSAPALVYVGAAPNQGAAWPRLSRRASSRRRKRWSCPAPYVGYLSWLLAEQKKGPRG